MCIVAQKIGPHTAGLIPREGNRCLFLDSIIIAFYLGLQVLSKQILRIQGKSMECANCGVIGHTFRDCAGPVLSYGVIAVKFLSGVPHYLLVRRRDSISYVEFLRGKYKMDNPEYITLLINGMSHEERRRLLSGEFNTLWETLWNSQNTRQFRNEYEMAHRTFDAIRNTGDVHGRLLVEYVERATETWM